MAAVGITTLLYYRNTMHPSETQLIFYCTTQGATRSSPGLEDVVAVHGQEGEEPTYQWHRLTGTGSTVSRKGNYNLVSTTNVWFSIGTN